jgi:hypothetical protein|nr:MAG TPA: tail component protein [Caudoviricetes sp.]
MPRYTAKLSPGSFRELAEKVRKYRLSLPEKCEEFARRLSEIGLQKANMILSEHVETGQTIGSLRIENNSDGKISRMTVVVSSNAILFLEFGAGVKYSKTENPKADELGYGPGTYPTGKGHWNDPDGWWYQKEEGGEWYHTYGTKACMPMYKASVEMRDKIVKIAREVFGND